MIKLVGDSNLNLLTLCKCLTNYFSLLISKLDLAVKAWPNAFLSTYDRAYQRNIHIYIIDERGEYVEY